MFVVFISGCWIVAVALVGRTGFATLSSCVQFVQLALPTFASALQVKEIRDLPSIFLALTNCYMNLAIQDFHHRFFQGSFSETPGLDRRV